MGSGLIVILIIVGLVLFLIGVYNGIVGKKIAAENAWSQIEILLKRRHDLIPNLVETVKGYAGHEKDTLERVIQARNAAVSAGGSVGVPGMAQAEGALSGALRQLFAVAESYPDLKANQNFLQLQGELVSTEDKISSSRQQYNNAVGSYNAAIQQVPGNFVAGFGNFTPKEFFELSSEERAAANTPPKVSFS